MLCIAGSAAAHFITPEEVLASLQSPGTRNAFGIESAERDGKLPRLLFIRVGPHWSAIPEGRRIGAAEEWQYLWADAVPSGIVAILDAVTDQPLVNFDGNGRAVLKTPPASPPSARPSPAAG